MSVSAWLYGGLRAGAQALWGLLAAYAASRGVTLPEALHSWFVEILITGGIVSLATMALKWLETRKGDGAGARVARWVSAILMLGLSAKQPVYVTPDTRAVSTEVTFANGQTSTTLRE